MQMLGGRGDNAGYQPAAGQAGGTAPDPYASKPGRQADTGFQPGPGSPPDDDIPF
jgi:hypothetical protein